MNPILYIKKIPGKGRGVYSRNFIAKDELIETCPVLVIPAADYETVKASRLVDYFFSFNKEENTLALALGFGSLYNHARYNNASYRLNREDKLMEYYALEDIPEDTEICINYSGEYGAAFTEWFEARDITCT